MVKVYVYATAFKAFLVQFQVLTVLSRCDTGGVTGSDFVGLLYTQKIGERGEGTHFSFFMEGGVKIICKQKEFNFLVGTHHQSLHCGGQSVLMGLV